MSYLDVKSPTVLSWAFLMICHVPRLFFDQCFTTLITEKTAPAPEKGFSQPSPKPENKPEQNSDFDFGF